jgi:hypothetical protein
LPKKTIEAIVDSGNEYVIQVKSNQKGLFSGVKRTIRNTDIVDEYENLEKNKGRVEKRRVRIYKYYEHYISKDWKSLKRIIEVVNTGTRGGKKYFEKHYYISGLSENSAEVFAKGIRGQVNRESASQGERCCSE